SLPPDLFAREVRFFGGIPPELESGSEIEALLVERLRSDFAMVAEYEYRPGPLLDVPVVALAGVDDPHLGRDRVRRWQGGTARPMELHARCGGQVCCDAHPGAARAILRRTVAEHTSSQETHVELF